MGGFCSVCKKEIGGIFKPSAYQCPGCKKLFCKDCAPRSGMIIKKPCCPECGVQLKRIR